MEAYKTSLCIFIFMTIGLINSVQTKEDGHLQYKNRYRRHVVVKDRFFNSFMTKLLLNRQKRSFVDQWEDFRNRATTESTTPPSTPPSTPPTSPAPTTPAPVTAAPVTEAPVTKAPVTEAPSLKDIKFKFPIFKIPLPNLPIFKLPWERRFKLPF